MNKDEMMNVAKNASKNYWIFPKWGGISAIIIFCVTLIWSAALSFSKLDVVETDVEVLKEHKEKTEQSIGDINHDLQEIKMNLRAFMNSQGIEYIER